jgi:phosphatidylserine/phosphatidylglycerophosphate/cardiolipin synthase-like enzyme
VKILANAVFALLVSVLPVLASGPAVLQTLNNSAAADIRVPEVTPPVLTGLPAKGAGYDWSGLPAYIFTADERVSPPLVTAIDRTRYTLDIALYNLQFEDTIDAMLRAKARGVKVRMLFDYDHVYPKANPQIQRVIDSGIETRVMKGRGGSGSMHCKYAIFDATLLETGSANWSNLAEQASYENLMFLVDPHIVTGYRYNYEWMWSQAKPAGQPDAPSAKPSAPPADSNRSVNFNGTALPNYVFSPRGGTIAEMTLAIDASRREVDVAMFAFTSRPLFDALSRAAARGVKVKLLLNAKSAFPFKDEAKQNKISVRWQEGRTENGIMHHKYAVLDDSLLINGSFNWSATAEDINTENTIFTMVPDYVNPFKTEFEKLYAY